MRSGEDRGSRSLDASRVHEGCAYLVVVEVWTFRALGVRRLMPE